MSFQIWRFSQCRYEKQFLSARIVSRFNITDRLSVKRLCSPLETLLIFEKFSDSNNRVLLLIVGASRFAVPPAPSSVNNTERRSTFVSRYQACNSMPIRCFRNTWRWRSSTGSCRRSARSRNELWRNLGDNWAWRNWRPSNYAKPLTTLSFSNSSNSSRSTSSSKRVRRPGQTIGWSPIARVATVCSTSLVVR